MFVFFPFQSTFIPCTLIHDVQLICFFYCSCCCFRTTGCTCLFLFAPFRFGPTERGNILARAECWSSSIAVTPLAN